MDINVTIKCPDLPLSATTLADAIAKLTVLAMLTPEADIKPESIKAAMQAAPAQIVTQQPAAAPTASVQASVAANPIPGAQQSPIPAAAITAPAPTPAAPSALGAVPTTPTPQITGGMVAKAGADLIAANPAAMAQLNGLLQKYGVGCAQELRPDQIGPFATEMRALGAKI